MSEPLNVLGLNAWHPDSSACLVRDGVLIAAAEEERFTRVKHWSGFPAQSIRWCLEEAGIDARDVDWIAVNRDPRAGLLQKVRFAFRRRPSLKLLKDRLENRSRVVGVQEALAAGLGVPAGELKARVHNVEHHRAHLSSSFLVSPFDEAVVLSVDGFGDFASTASGIGAGNRIEIDGRVRFPHSLGLLYLAVTQHLGFPRYGDEYKVMGMAGYGEPRHVDLVRRLVRPREDGGFELALEYFRHHTEGVEMSWDGGSPDVGRAASDALAELLGPARDPAGELDQRHFDLAASLQAVYEEVLFHMLRALAERTGLRELCLSGGCAMNGLANGKITTETPFEALYVPPAPGDAGGAVGAALDLWCRRLGRERACTMDHAYHGPGYGSDNVEALLRRSEQRLRAAGCTLRRIPDRAELCRATAARIAAGDVVGWFQGRMEWGPRALGNRSILADPRRRDVRELLNAKIKLRESFRPFAPSVLAEEADRWFQSGGDVPFMLEIRSVLPERRTAIPAVTHVDGTGRLQTVSRESNPLYYELIDAFRDETGVPMLLNTSFNENEPVVCRPEEALDCFLRTRMDALALGEHLIERAAA